jgi:hypothetical protein
MHSPRFPRSTRWLAVAALGHLVGTGASADAHAPTPYAQPAHESPVRGAPDDLLLIAGDGFTAADRVVYQAVSTTTDPPQHPTDVPPRATGDSGYATVVSSRDVPHSLTVRLPAAMRPGQSYALWIEDADGAWSVPVLINDLRPLWLSPSYVYETHTPAGLPRVLKLVGRNVDPAPGRTTQIELTGPETLRLDAMRSDPATDEYVARVTLPERLSPGTYRVAASRDGSSWVALTGQDFVVRTDPAAEPSVDLADPRNGGCRPRPDEDATRCLVRAIAAAAAAGRGTVTVGPGPWTLIHSDVAGVVPGDGIVVPRGVSLRGFGAQRSRIVRRPEWNAAGRTATFTLQGDNRVEGIAFEDAQRYGPTDHAGPMLQLGEDAMRRWQRTHAVPPSVADVVIAHDVFVHTDAAIADAGLAIERLFITYNDFGSYRNPLELGGNLYDTVNRFRIDDSVIAFNRFEPGSFLDDASHDGPIASEIGAARRLDFSDNIADGASTRYLYAPGDPPGWRAAFFWHLNDSQEMVLIADNSATCTGDKTGDGEAIALDNSGNTFAFEAMRRVAAADASSVTVAGPLASRQNDRDVPAATYYIGHWIEVGDGPGMGQVREIADYTQDASTGRVRFEVLPAWDVVPVPDLTRIAVGREFWQTYVLGNHVDHRHPPCRKANRSRAVGGAIALWAQLADSVAAGNSQYDSDGITLHENYNSPLRACATCGAETFFQSFLEVRDNLIDGRYDGGSSCTTAGITAGVSAAPGGLTAPPTLGYGIDIAHNHLIDADNSAGAAIASIQGWYDGPAPHRWPLMDTLLVQHNLIDGNRGPEVGAACHRELPRRGIAFPGAPLTWRSVLYANRCRGVDLPFAPGGVETTRVCPSGAADDCECAH